MHSFHTRAFSFFFLCLAGKRCQLKIYPTSEHLFREQDFATAAARELDWFERHR